MCKNSNLDVHSYLSVCTFWYYLFFELEYKKSSTGSFRDQLTPLNYIQLCSELNHCCLGLSRAVTIRRWKEAEREIDFICHWSTLLQYASVTFKMALNIPNSGSFLAPEWELTDCLTALERGREKLISILRSLVTIVCLLSAFPL